MRIRKVLLGLLLSAVMVLALSGVYAEAATLKNVILIPTITHETHESYTIYIQTPIAYNEVKSIDFQKGKVKKTANKYWKNADLNLTPRIDGETGYTQTSFYISENGYYSARITTKSGERYVNYIKISNFAPVSEDSEYVAKIKKVSKPNSKGNFTITVDYLTPLVATESDFSGKNIGDIVNINGREVEILEFNDLDYFEIIGQDNFDKNTSMVVVKPVDSKDFSDIVNDSSEKVFAKNPDAAYGYIRGGDGVFTAYLEYDSWDGGDFYGLLYETVKSGIKYKVTSKTNVKLYRINWQYKDAKLTMSGKDYLAIRKGIKEQVEWAYVSKTASMRIYQAYDKKTGEFTNVISEIIEIYKP